jgi:glycosyltransferase involved in cell wall biosynthesis
VVIPAFNAGNYITQTLQSLANQDAIITSIIIVNDGSTDDTSVRVLEFSKSSPDLNIALINQKNAGLSAARNTGIRHSKADYIAFLDADDLWKPNKLSSQIELLKLKPYPHLGVIYCGYQLIDESGKNIAASPKAIISPALRGNVYQPLLRGNFISGSGSSVLIKRSVFSTIGFFDEQLKACEDWDMWLRIARQFQFDYVDTELVLIRVHPHNMQKDVMRMLSAELMVLNKFAEQEQSNSFLLWKIRTYLFNKDIPAHAIPGFERCNPKLQVQLSGWRMNLASCALIPLQILANTYLKFSGRR